MDAREFIKYAAAFAVGAYTQHKYIQHQVFRDPAFISILDVALQNTKNEDIDKLIYLEPDQLRDWVMAPDTFRPKLLQKWADEKQQEIEDKEILDGMWRRQKKYMFSVFIVLFIMVCIMVVELEDKETYNFFINILVGICSIAFIVLSIGVFLKTDKERKANERNYQRMFKEIKNSIGLR